MQTPKRRIGLLAQLFASNANYVEIEISPFEFKLKGSDGVSEQEAGYPVSCLVERGIVWSTLHPRHADKSIKSIGGLSNKNAEELR